MINLGDPDQFEQEAEENYTSDILDLGDQSINHLADKLREHIDISPTLSGGDVDAAWEDADIGAESVAGSNPTPDQDQVDEIGKAMGLTFEDNEPLDFSEKIEKRDRDRWELNPASAEDFGYEL